MSVSSADTLNRKPEHVCSKAPEELVQKFWETVVRRGEVLREDIKQKYFPTDFEMLPKKQQLAINEWCNQIPVVGFITTLGIDIFKDAVSFPGVSLKYLLRGTLGKKREAPELFAPERRCRGRTKLGFYKKTRSRKNKNTLA